MASYYKEGSKIQFNGFKGTIERITETYKKNVLVVKISESPKKNPYSHDRIERLGLFEYPDGKIEFMSIID